MLAYIDNKKKKALTSKYVLHYAHHLRRNLSVRKNDVNRLSPQLQLLLSADFHVLLISTRFVVPL